MNLFPKRKINCLKDCNAACCHDMTIKVLGEDEFKLLDRLKAHGIQLKPLDVQENFPAGVYLVEGSCPARNMGKGRVGCSDHSKERLRSCEVTMCGSEECRAFRERDGY